MESDKGKILIDLTFRSVSGKSLYDLPGAVSKEKLADYRASEKTRSSAIELLQSMGFEITGAISEFGVSVTSTKENVRKVFGSLDELVIPDALSPWIDKAVIPPPGEFFE